jgi:DNA polymerase III subunit epsilon
VNHLLSLRRRCYAHRAVDPETRVWLGTSLPSRSAESFHVPYLVVDLEMTGLDYREDKIISVGWVEINEGAIALSSARHLYIKRRKSVGQSAVIHQIRDVDLEQGMTEADALAALRQASLGKVLVFHSAVLDYRFLDRVWRKQFGVPFLVPVVDTLQLEKQHFDRSDRPLKSGDLRLASCRTRYGLPSYPGHNALVDALATAELLLAILARKKVSTLRSILA